MLTDAIPRSRPSVDRSEMFLKNPSCYHVVDLSLRVFSDESSHLFRREVTHPKRPLDLMSKVLCENLPLLFGGRFGGSNILRVADPHRRITSGLNRRETKSKRENHD